MLVVALYTPKVREAVHQIETYPFFLYNKTNQLHQFPKFTPA